MMTTRLSKLCAVFAFAALFGASAMAAKVSAKLEPALVGVGESAQLTVTVSGTRAARPTVPAVDGLDISHVGESTQIRVINGAMDASAAHTYLVTPQRAGAFTIPAIEVEGAKTTPIALRAEQRSGNATAPRGSARGNLPPPQLAAPSASATAPADRKYGFLQLTLPKKEFYVGEVVPVEIRAYIPDGLQASVTGLPVLSSEAFTANPLGDKPARAEQEIDGRSYTVLTWHSAITAVKAGDYSLNMQMPVTVVVRERQRPRARGRSGSLFDMFDDFFDDPFFARGTEKQITLASEADAMKVLPLPAEKQPAGFRGAVGKFEIEASVEPAKAMAGDPLTLRMKVRGAGNFDRVASDLLEATPEWKTYPPKSSVAPADSAGIAGTKTFEQLIVASGPEVTSIPALTFSFFDPETREYVTRSTPPIAVEITPAPAGAVPAPLPDAPTAAAAKSDELLPNKVEAGRFVSTLRPLFLQPWFLAVQAVPVLALAAGLVWLRRRRRLATDPHFARATAAERAIRAQLEEMDRALSTHEPLAFFTSARGALQHRLAERWQVSPESITLAEVYARLNGSGAKLREIFQMTDALTYSGQQVAGADLRRWKEQVLAELQRLKT